MRSYEIPFLRLGTTIVNLHTHQLWLPSLIPYKISPITIIQGRGKASELLANDRSGRVGVTVSSCVCPLLIRKAPTDSSKPTVPQAVLVNPDGSQHKTKRQGCERGWWGPERVTRSSEEMGGKNGQDVNKRTLVEV